MRRKYNVKLISWLKDNAKNYTVKEIIPLVNKKFKETYNDKSIRKLFYSNKIEYKYECKQRSYNNAYKKPIGTEYVRSDGMTLVKTGKNEWKYKQRLIYEQHYGIELSSDMYVIFLDQDRNNFDINNLRAVSNHESCILSNQKLFSKNPVATETGILIAKNIIKTKTLEKRKK